MPSAPEGRPVKVKVMDKRASARTEAVEGTASAPQDEETMNQAAEHVQDVERALLDDLRRLQAEFDNYRKRMVREQTAMTTRASANLVSKLLPVLDNLERAIEHGEGGPGMELLLKEFKQVLQQEGLEEIAAEGEVFDPRIHEAFQVVEDPDASEPTVRTVYRRGYRMNDSVVRPPMVVVAQPRRDELDEAGMEHADDRAHARA